MFKTIVSLQASSNFLRTAPETEILLLSKSIAPWAVGSQTPHNTVFWNTFVKFQHLADSVQQVVKIAGLNFKMEFAAFEHSSFQPGILTSSTFCNLLEVFLLSSCNLATTFLPKLLKSPFCIAIMLNNFCFLKLTLVKPELEKDTSSCHQCLIFAKSLSLQHKFLTFGQKSPLAFASTLSNPPLFFASAGLK